MTKLPTWLTRAIRLAWTHLSAFVALILIVAALFVGYRIGRPASVETTTTTTAVAGPATIYTCSMHPTVRLPDPNAKCPICFMDLIPVADDGGQGNERRLVMTEESARRSAIETVAAGRFFPTAEVRLYGKLTYDETSVARITAYFPGRLERLFVNYVGVPVFKGDHLAEIYSPQLIAAAEELRQARIAVETLTSSSPIVRRSTEQTLTASREKLRLFGLTDEQIERAETGESAVDRLTIYSPMAGIVTHLAAREGDYVATGSPLATVADLSRLWLDMESYESQLPLLRWGQAVTFTVEAHPGERFEGRISFIEPLVDTRTRTAAVRVAVDNRDRRLKPGMFASAVVRPRVAADGAVVSDELAGRWVCPMHPTVVKDEPGQCDVCGMALVSAESLGVVGDPALAVEPLVIPRTAVLLTGKRAIVYVKVPNTKQPTYEVREVVLGARAGDFYIVKSGLRDGDEVVVNGAFRIDSAMQIAAKPSMMMPAPDSDQKAARDASAPESFLDGLDPVFAAYLDAQASLASDAFGQFSTAATALEDAIASVNEVGLVGETLGMWRRVKAKLRPVQPVATIDEARVWFERMSEGVIALERRFGHAGEETWHLAYCPMAFDNKGAEWIQRGTTIDNPYFGASMLRCGKIRADFPPVSNVVTPSGPTSRPHLPAGEGHDHE